MRFNMMVSGLVVLAVSMVGSVARGQSMPSEWALGEALTMSTQYQGQRLWFEWDVQGVGTARASAIRINEHYGITAAHLFQQTGFVGSNFRVGNGPNVLTNRGEERFITDWGVHPTWHGTLGGDAVDLAWFRWDEVLAGTNVTAIGASVLGQTLIYDGFGRRATPDTGYLTADGFSRAFLTGADFYGSGSMSSDYIQSIFVPPSLGGNPLGGGATSGSSGAAGYNYLTGELVTMAVAQSGAPGYFSSTYGLRLDLYEPWITSNVPSPGAFALFGMGAVVALRRRR